MVINKDGDNNIWINEYNDNNSSNNILTLKKKKNNDEDRDDKILLTIRIELMKMMIIISSE